MVSVQVDDEESMIQFIDIPGSQVSQANTVKSDCQSQHFHSLCWLLVDEVEIYFYLEFSLS